MDAPQVGSQELTLISYLETRKFAEAAASATRLANKLKIAVQNSEFYETHQILTTVYFRFNAHREKIEALVELLYHGAIFLLKHGEFTSGQEIASLFLETSAKRLQARLDEPESSEIVKQFLLRPSIAYHSEHQTLDLDICQKTANIAIQLPDEELGRPKFIAESLKLLSPKILNRDLLHNVIANRFRDAKEYADARYHYLHCANLDNAHDVAALLFEFYTQNGYKSERDMFITQFILQFLCIQHPIDPPLRVDQHLRQRQQQQRHQSHSNVGPSSSTVSRKSRDTIRRIADEIFSAYAESIYGERVEVPFPAFLLLNFTCFIISILDSVEPEARAYKTLLDVYRPLWSRDPNFEIYLDRIGALYFGLVDQSKQQQQHGPGGGGFFNSILMSLLDASDDEGDASTPELATEPYVTSCDDVD